MRKNSILASARRMGLPRTGSGICRFFVLAAVSSCGRWGYDDSILLANTSDVTSGGPDPVVGASCADAVISGQETDVDCGGPDCLPCQDNLACARDADCSNRRCLDGRCQSSSCTDQIQGEGETGVDCGGSQCAPCPTGLACARAEDCTSALCLSGVCREPSCGDGLLNQDETGADCGGGTCEPCSSGTGCSGSVDCASAVCASGVCQEPSCGDGVSNGSESDVDCGGSASGCAPCGVGASCNEDTDCADAMCRSGLCRAPGCDDGLQNSGETGVDCGGPCGATCADGDACAVPSDCVSDGCEDDVCVSCSDGARNRDESDVDCGGTACGACGDGAACATPSDCTSLVCSLGFCQSPSCSDGVLNQDETSIDCGGACGTLCDSLSAALIHRYRFDGSGSSIVDSAGSSHGTLRNTSLSGTGTASLSGGFSDQFVDLPNGIVSALTNASFETWLTWDGGSTRPWQRIFDFGRSNDIEGRQGTGVSYLALSPQGDNISNFILFRYCSNRGPTGDCRNDGLELEARGTVPLASGVMKHVVALFDDDNNVMRIYVDGTQVGSRSNSRRLSEIIDVNNWLGRSQYSGDPELDGHLHEFRIYSKALSVAEIQYSRDRGPNPSFLP